MTDSELDNFYGVYTYKEPLIFNKTDNYNNKYHREVSFRRDPLLRIYVTKLDEEMFTELPIFQPDILNARSKKEESVDADAESLTLYEKEIPEEGNKTVIRDWMQEDWNSLLVKILDTGRVHRWGIIKLYKEYPYWGVYSVMEVKEIKYSDNGEPLEAKVVYFKHLPYSFSSLLMFDDVIKFGDDEPTIFFHYGKPEGRYVDSDDIEHVWDLMVELRYIRHDIVRNSAKSSGFYFMKLGKAANPKHEAYVEDIMQRANYGNIVAASEGIISDIIDIHPENAAFSIKAYDKMLKAFAGACRLPLTFFNSETEKSGLGEESRSEDDILVNKKKKFVFGQFKSIILKLVEKRWGVECEDVFPNLEEYEEENYKEDIVEKNEPIQKKEKGK